MSTETIVSFPLSSRPVAPADAALVAGLRAGSGPAFATLVSTYRPRVYAIAHRFTHHHHDAEDIVQEVFFRAFRAAPRFRGDCALSTWLYAITLNVARNRHKYWRRRGRELTISLDTPSHPDTQSALQQAVDPAPGAAEASECHDFAAHVQQGLARLRPRDRQILHLRNVEHADYLTIARPLGVAIGTVKSRIARARQRLHTVVYAHLHTDAALLRRAS